MEEGIDLETRWKINSVQILLQAAKKSVMKLTCFTKNGFPVMNETSGTKKDRVPHKTCHKKSVTSQGKRETFKI